MLNNGQVRLLLLVLCCFLFYSYKNLIGTCLILVIILIDNLFSRNSLFIHKSKFLLISIFISLGILFVFKYFNFVVLNYAKLYEFFFSSKLNPYLISLVLPPGISFYTFQSVAYILDVYNEKIPPEKSILNYSIFLGFFPQLVAGPIVNAAHFLPQIEKLKSIQFKDIYLKKAIYFFLLGFIKKSVLADNISVISDQCFHIDFIHVMSSFSLFVGMISYSIQIYMDFSGYSDMAIGLAYFFGIELPENFRYPYLASSITEFWRRWHITLSTWLKDYLYIPLGGSKNGSFNTYKNLILTMLIGGFWHGASLNFIVWGGIHGIWLSLERVFHRKSDVRPDDNLMIQIFKILFVFVLISFIWIFFRAENMEMAIHYFYNIFQFKNGLELGYTKLNLFYLILVLMFFGKILGQKYELKLNYYMEKESNLGYYFCISIMIIGSILLSGNAKPFIYFVF